MTKDKPISICILSHPRSGSTWFIERITNCTIKGLGTSSGGSSEINLNIAPNSTVSFGEFFRPDRLSLFIHKNFPYIYNKDAIPQKISLSKFLEIKKILNEKYQSSFAFKVFRSHLPFENSKNITVKNLIDYSDVIILQYRNNLLECWISYLLALKTKTWNVHKQEAEDYFEKNGRKNIVWKKQEFINYSITCKEWIEDCEAELKKRRKKYVKISYEEQLLKNFDEILNEKMKTCGFEKISIYGSKIQKIPYQNNELISKIKNKEDFLKDYESIKKYMFIEKKFVNII